MPWATDGPCAYVRDDGRYAILRASMGDGSETFTLVDKRSHEIVASERRITKEGKQAAWDALVAQCEPRNA